MRARENYLPREQRAGIGLCLSGGGSRAALFHLGVLRRLNEVGALSQVDTISTVSGGSILAAHLAATIPEWPAPGESIPDFERRVVAPFERFVQRNLRTAAIAKRLLPWNLGRERTQVVALSGMFQRFLNGSQLASLPVRPEFVFCASDNAFAVNWTFTRDRVGDYMAGYAATPPDWTIAQAVAASSCFPPVLDPMPIDIDPSQLTGGRYPLGRARDQLIRGLRLSDGGLYDNLALEPVWKSHAVVIVSDGGGTLDPQADVGLRWRVKRYATIMGRQATSVRKRWLVAGYINGVFQGAYMGIGSAVSSYETGGLGYPADLVDETISEVRTDLDRFSPAEIGVLQNHGYLLAEAAVQRHLAATPVVIRPAPVRVPAEEYIDTARVREELRDSHKVKWLGRGPWLRYLF